jgi:hypothetical protein
VNYVIHLLICFSYGKQDLSVGTYQLKRSMLQVIFFYYLSIPCDVNKYEKQNFAEIAEAG